MADSSWDRGGQAHQVMEGLVRDFGPQVLSNAQLLKNLLGDKLPTAPRETSLLVAAAEAGVAGMLRDRLGQQLPPEMAIHQVVAALEEQRGYDATACAWVVTEFARAMGHAVEEPATVPSPGRWPQPEEDDPTAPVVAPLTGNGWQDADATVEKTAETPAVPPPPAPPPRSTSGSRAIVIAAVAIGIAAVVVVAALLIANSSKGGGGPTPTSTAASTAPSTTTPAQNPQIAEAQAVQAILNQSAQVRPSVGNAVNAIGSCGDIQGGITALQNAAATRHNLLAQATNLNVADIPDGTSVKSDLVRALDASATADQDYAAWGRDVASQPCSGTAPLDGNYTAAGQSDQQATTAKQLFVAVWNPTAQKAGLPPADPNAF